MSTIVQHSLVTHPVGFHFDAYSRHGHGDVIENKICLVNINKNNRHCTTALGRGGSGPGKYVFAILDWGNGLNHNTNTVSRLTDHDCAQIQHWPHFLDKHKL